MGKRITKEIFIEKGNKIHENKYDYSKVEYKTTHDKVCIICPEHGEFWQTPHSHVSGKSGCPYCAINRKMTMDIFLKKAEKVHKNKYDYSKVVLKTVMDKVCIICPEHGEFWQTPNDHVNSKRGCPKCAHRSYRKTTEEFIEESKQKFGNKFDYSKVLYERKDKPVCIICPKHGEFWQSPNVHLRSTNGCPKCVKEENGNKKRLTQEIFIEKARKIHGDKYDYSKVEYVNVDTKVCIICPEHGEFWQTPHNHIGQKQGCPYCTNSHLENEISVLLTINNISFIQEKKFPWLKHKKSLSLDFYLPKYNIAIECQGEQHFYKFRWEKDNQKLEERQLRDNVKKILCDKHNVSILYYSFKKFDDKIITNKDKLLEIILQNRNEKKK